MICPVKPWGACRLDGIDPAALHPGLRLMDLAENRLDGRLTVTARFLLREANPLHRAAVLQQLMHWSGGQLLRVHYRPGQCLAVRRTGAGGVGNLVRFNEPIVLIWTAQQPLWQSDRLFGTTSDRPSAVQSLHLTVPCAEGAIAPDLTLQNAGDSALTAVTLQTDQSRIRLSGLSLAPGKLLRLAHDEAGLLVLTADHQSCPACRELLSSDDLLTMDGVIRIEADQPVTARASARGIYR